MLAYLSIFWLRFVFQEEADGVVGRRKRVRYACEDCGVRRFFSAAGQFGKPGGIYIVRSRNRLIEDHLLDRLTNFT
jgi:hypothetical protein